MNYQVDKDGYYGEFGGAFVPEMLHNNIEELKKAFYFYKDDEAFKTDFVDLLKDK